MPPPRRLPLSRLAKVTIVAVGASVLTLGGAGWWLWTHTVGYLPPPVPRPTPFQVAQVEKKLASVEQQLQTVRAAGRRRQARAFRLEMTEEEVNAYLAAHRAELKELRDPRVEIHPGNRVSLSGWVNLRHREMWCTASGMLTSQGPKLAIQVTEVKVGAVSLPASAREKLISQYQQALSDIDTGLPLASLSLQTAEGLVIVSGVSQ